MNYKFFVIGILLGGFVIIGASVYIGYSVRDVEIVDNAYASGLKFDEQRNQEARLGWRVEMPHELRSGQASDLEIMVRDRDGKALAGAVVALDLSRMGTRESNTFPCTGGAGGRYSARPSLEAGYWDAQVRVSRNNESMTFNEIISVVR